MTRIKEIKYEKKIPLYNKIEKKDSSKYVITMDNKSDVSELSLDSNKFDLKDIDNNVIIQKDNIDINNIEQNKDIAIKRNKTNTELREKIQILTLPNNKDKKNIDIISPELNKKLNFNNIKGKNTNEKICRIC